jgi:inhibitor of the pro-sigma K processing machinery
MGFKEIMGYVLGVLTVLVVSGVCLKPMKMIVKFLLNSVAGIGLCMLINYIGTPMGIHIGINPATSIILGMLGVPGLIMILIAQIFC